MKELRELKSDLLNKKFNQLYIFYGSEWKIRDTYIEYIAKHRGDIEIVSEIKDIYKKGSSVEMIKTNKIYICYDDIEFSKATKQDYERLLELSKDKTIIIVYNNKPSSLLLKTLDEYVTEFKEVVTDIAVKYVKQNCNKDIDDTLAREIAFSCDNNYGHILSEVDKLNYADNPLSVANRAMLNIKSRLIAPKDLANLILSNNNYEIAKNFNQVKKESILYYIPELYSSATIMIYIKLYNKWSGSSKAYEAGEFWGRVKEIREINTSYTAQELNDIRYLVNRLEEDVRTGKISNKVAWGYLIGVIL